MTNIRYAHWFSLVPKLYCWPSYSCTLCCFCIGASDDHVLSLKYSATILQKRRHRGLFEGNNISRWFRRRNPTPHFWEETLVAPIEWLTSHVGVSTSEPKSISIECMRLILAGPIRIENRNIIILRKDWRSAMVSYWVVYGSAMLAKN